MYRIRKIIDPGIFQGKYRTKNYFEGWYVKLIDRSMEHTVAIIPGISIGKNRSDAHAFIQVLMEGNQVSYFRYSMKDFKYSKNKFAILIGDNYFSDNKLILNLCDDKIQIYGKLIFSHILKLPKSLYMPGIMGPFSYIPWMECYHGVINIRHTITGSLNIAGNKIDFTQGLGYIEKDWGSSFPKTWVWIQSNHFTKTDATIMFSVARIPWFGSSFLGFLSFLRLGSQIYVFATYTGAKLKMINLNHDILTVIIEDRHYFLKITVNHMEGGKLMAPHKGLMKRVIKECTNAEAKVILLDKKGHILFEGIGLSTGLEIV